MAGLVWQATGEEEEEGNLNWLDNIVFIGDLSEFNNVLGYLGFGYVPPNSSKRFYFFFFSAFKRQICNTSMYKITVSPLVVNLGI